ncbi:unnamed protein product [Ectocarpus sp. CCAP 1310/34]|nr:unnamed protein product [Ectocarpus sp. CCAP 1310/34]
MSNPTHPNDEIGDLSLRQQRAVCWAPLSQQTKVIRSERTHRAQTSATISEKSPFNQHAIINVVSHEKRRTSKRPVAHNSLAINR